MSWLAAQAPMRPGASRLSVGGLGAAAGPAAAGGGKGVVASTVGGVGGIGVGGVNISSAAAANAAALSMYDEPPQGDVSIEEFEVAAIDRLRVLKGIEEAKAKGHKLSVVEQTAVKLFAEHIGPHNPAKDLLSHYALRLAYCRTDDLRRWLLSHETELFRARFRALLPDERSAFVASVGKSGNSNVPRLPVRPLSAAEFEAHRARLADVADACAFGADARRFASDVAAGAARAADFFAAPFEEVPDLVAGRKCLLVAGEAIVSKHDAGSVVSSAFRAALSAGLSAAARAWGASSSSASSTTSSSHSKNNGGGGGVAASEADRLAPVVESLSQRHLGLDDWNSNDASRRDASDSIRTAADVRRADASRSLPLCMSSMLAGLDRDRHLKHKGRLQLGLFLKGAGLPLDEALRFWRDGFGTLGGDEFDKRYAYGVRFNYGKEGKRADYTPYSCVKIVTTPVDAGDCAGCPYKTQSPEALAALLSTRLKLSGAAAAGVVAKARAGHYQLACASAWEAVHGGRELESGVNHPNQYFDASRRATREEREEREKKGEGGGGGEAAMKKEGEAAAAAAAAAEGAGTAAGATPAAAAAAAAPTPVAVKREGAS